MTNWIHRQEKYILISKIIGLIIAVLILVSSSSIAEIDMPIPVDLQVVDGVVNANDISSINYIYNKSGIIIWEPEINGSDGLKCYAMLNKSNNKISVSLIGSEEKLSSFLVPSNLTGSDLIAGGLNRKTKLYGMLKNVSEEAGLELKGTPTYNVKNSNLTDIVIRICIGKTCEEISVKNILNINIKKLIFVPPFSIFNLKPEDNATPNAGPVEFTWQTELPSSSTVTIWKDESRMPEIIKGPDNVVRHSVKYNLSCGSSYRYNVTSSISNATKTISVTVPVRHLEAPFPITNLTPKDNATLNASQVEFTWQTECPSSSEVTIWMDAGRTPKTIKGPDNVINHRVVIENLSCNSSFWYVAASRISDRSATSERRHFQTGKCGLVFIGKPYDFKIGRDYNQVYTILFMNMNSKGCNVSLNAINPYSDIRIGFIETGTENESIYIGPSKSAERKLIVHAQDASKKQYNVTINLVNEDESIVADTAQATINIDFIPDFTIREVASDSKTLVKTIKINNLGDKLTDLRVRANPESQICLHPVYDHASLSSGDNLTFYAVPLFAEGREKIIGNITATAGNMSKSIVVDFSCTDGKRIIPVTLNYPQITIEKNDEYCTNDPDINVSFNIPYGFDASDVVSARMTQDFSLPWPRSLYRKHNVIVYLNNHIIDQMKDVIPEGTYSYDLSHSYFNYAIYGIDTSGVNVLRLKTEHLNPAHYVVSGKASFSLCLRKLERWVCASSEEEAEQILWETPGITPVPDNLYVNIAQPLNNSTLDVNRPITIKALVNGSVGGSIRPQSNLMVSAETAIAGETFRISLYDDGKHSDSQEDDGIYAAEWTPVKSGWYNINVSAENCRDSGSSNVWVHAVQPPIKPPFDLNISEIDTVKSSKHPDKVDVHFSVANIGEETAPAFRANLSVIGEENADYSQNIAVNLGPGEDVRLDNWTLNEAETCGKEIRICVEANSPENNTDNNCLVSGYCLDCGNRKPEIVNQDLEISELKHETDEISGQIAVGFTVKNIGSKDVMSPIKVELSINGMVSDSIDIGDGLAASQVYDGAFSISDLSEGNYSVSICVDADKSVNESNESNNCKAEILQIGPPNYDFIILNVENTCIPANTSLNFTAKNIGSVDSAGPIKVELSINGTVSDSIDIGDGLAAGQVYDGAFDISDLSEGNYSVSICVDSDNSVYESNEENNCGFAYLRSPCDTSKVIINNPGSEVSNYTVSVKMPATGSDHLRFVDEMGRELYYWVEEGSEAGSNVRIWIKAISIHTGQNIVRVSIDSTSSDHQDPENVFEFFDDFNNGDLSQWIRSISLSGNIAAENGAVRFAKTSSRDTQQISLQSYEKFSSEWSAIFRADLGPGMDRVRKALGFVENNDPKANPSLSWLTDGKDLLYHSDAGLENVENNFASGYRVFEIRRQNNGIFFSMDGEDYGPNSIISSGSAMPLEFGIQSQATGDSTYMILDWVAVRNCSIGDLPATYSSSI